LLNPALIERRLVVASADTSRSRELGFQIAVDVLGRKSGLRHPDRGAVLVVARRDF
jgi:hypothetical protein